MKLNIKNAHIEDLNAINELLRLSKGYWGYDEAFLDKFMQKMGVTEIYLQNNLTKTAYLNDQLIGFFSFISETNQLVLDNLFLKPDYIGQDLGRGLWNECCEIAKSIGYDEFILVSDPYAENFYLKMGCQKIGEQPSPMIVGRFNPVLKCKLESLECSKKSLSQCTPSKTSNELEIFTKTRWGFL